MAIKRFAFDEDFSQSFLAKLRFLLPRSSQRRELASCTGIPFHRIEAIVLRGSMPLLNEAAAIVESLEIEWSDFWLLSLPAFRRSYRGTRNKLRFPHYHCVSEAYPGGLKKFIGSVTAKLG